MSMSHRKLNSAKFHDFKKQFSKKKSIERMNAGYLKSFQIVCIQFDQHRMLFDANFMRHRHSLCINDDCVIGAVKILLKTDDCLFLT